MSSDDDFTMLTEQDKQHYAYGLCVLGMAATGAMYGSLAGGQTVAGFVGGGAVGMLLCKTIDQPLKRRLFSDIRLPEHDFKTLASQTKRQFPQLSRSQVFNLLAASRMAAIKDPLRYRC